MLTRIRRYGTTQLVSSSLDIQEIYFAPKKLRSDVAYGQDIRPGYFALFDPEIDLVVTDSIVYQGNESAISSFHRVEYEGVGYVIKVEFR